MMLLYTSYVELFSLTSLTIPLFSTITQLGLIFPDLRVLITLTQDSILKMKAM
jgi:hypothetical protein